MTVERGSVSISADLTVQTEPGMFVYMRPAFRDETKSTFTMSFSGAQGAIALGRLIEEAKALRAELDMVV